MTIGLYGPGESWLHRLPAGAKAGGLLAASLALFLIPSPLLALASVPAAFGVYLSTGASFRQLLADLRGPAMVLGFVFLFHAVFGSAAEGALAVARFAALILLAAAVTLTTPVSAMAALVEWLLGPLRPIGVRPEKVGLAVALSIRFVPLIAEEFRHNLRNG